MSRPRPSHSDPFPSDEAEILRDYQLKSLNPEAWIVHSEDFDFDEASATTSTAASTSKRDDFDPLGLRHGNIIKETPDLAYEDKVKIVLRSKNFDPKTFLSVVHPNATLNDLNTGKDNLKDSLQQRSKALRLLVEKEFDHFVNVKSATISVYEEMKQGPLEPNNDYSVKVLKDSLGEASSRADAMYTPILDARQKADRLRTTLGVLERSSFFFNLPSTLAESIENAKYDAALMTYKKGLYMKESRTTFLLGNQNSKPATSAQKQQCARIFDKVWSQVEIIISDMKVNMIKRLRDRSAPIEEVEKILDVLLEFDKNDESIWIFFESRHKFILGEIQKRYTIYSKRHQSNIADLQNVSEEESLLGLQNCFKGPEKLDDRYIMDGGRDVQAWASLLQVAKALSESTLTHFTPFWILGKSFLEGKYQKKSSSMSANSSRFKAMAQDILKKFVSLLTEFFELAKSISQRKEGSAEDSVINLPSFVPLCSNALTVGAYLQRAINDIHECCEDLGSLRLADEGSTLLKDFITSTRIKFEETLSTFWVKDVKKFYRLETWTPDMDLAHTTDFWRKMDVYQMKVLKTCYGIAGGSDETADSILGMDVKDGRPLKPRKEDILSPQCVKNVQSAYLDTLYAFLDGLVHVAFSPVMRLDSKKTAVQNPTARSGADVDNVDVRILFTVSNLSHFYTNVMPQWIEKASAAFRLNLSDDVKTLSEVVSQLDKILFEDLIKRRVEEFERIVHEGILGPDVDWVLAPRPTEVQPYIYQSLLALVLAHSQVGAVTKPLISRVLSTLVGELARVLLESFSQVNTFGLGGMLQATLEVEFVHQTLLSQVTAEAESDLQTIYQVISQTYYRDPEANDPEREKELKAELDRLKKILTDCNRATMLQFLCFKDLSKKKNEG